MTVAAEAGTVRHTVGALGAAADAALASGAAMPSVAALTPIANASDVAFESIRRALVEGRFAPGARLREVALAQQLGISPTPVREALARLKQEGLIEFEPRRGAVVPHPGREDVLEVYELRELLEAFAARRAAEHRSAPLQTRLLPQLA